MFSKNLSLSVLRICDSRELSYETASKEMAEAYLGFDIPLPSTLLEKYTCESYEINILPIWIQCRFDYTYGEHELAVMIYYFVDINDSALFTEQDENGEYIYGASISYAAYIGSGTYRITATYEADGYQITRNSNERSF